MKKEDIKVLLLDPLPRGAQNEFEKLGYHIDTHFEPITEAQLVKKIHNYQIICLGRNSDEPILTDEVLRSAHRLYAIGVFSVFKNQVDIPTSQAMGIPIFTAPYQHQHSVAELIISYLVLLSRQIGDRSKEIHSKEWNKVLLM
jgi:D-3-phosphoglycerate dehydrogenase